MEPGQVSIGQLLNERYRLDAELVGQAGHEHESVANVFVQVAMIELRLCADAEKPGRDSDDQTGGNCDEPQSQGAGRSRVVRRCRRAQHRGCSGDQADGAADGRARERTDHSPTVRAPPVPAFGSLAENSPSAAGAAVDRRVDKVQGKSDKPLRAAPRPQLRPVDGAGT